MSKTVTLLLLLVTLIGNAQQTKIPITGIDKLKLGDSVSIINTYGFPFKELILNKDSHYTERNPELVLLDSGKTFCNNARVFFTNQFTINNLKLTSVASLTLTYFNNRLIEIRILDSAKNIRNLYGYGISKYGKTFGKTWNAVKDYLGKREEAISPDKKIKKEKSNLIQPNVATISTQLKDDNFLESIFWVNGTNKMSFVYCSYPFQFWDNKKRPENEGRYDWGCVEAALMISNEKAYQKLIDCSNKDYLKLVGSSQ